MVDDSIFNRQVDEADQDTYWVKPWLIEICKQLVVAGAVEIHARFDGSGDSGTVESVEAFDAAGNVVSIPSHDSKRLFDFFGEVPPDDWYNDDGGYGVVKLNLVSGHMYVDENLRETRIESCEYDYKLIVDESTEE